MRWIVYLLGLGGITVLIRRWTKMIHQRAYDGAWEEATSERVRFLQRLDHELKNPLTAMQVALANLEDTTEPEKRSEIRAGLRGQILRMSHLISDLRKLAVLEKGGIEQLPVNPGYMLNEAAMIMQDNEQMLNRRFVTDFHTDDLPTVTGDEDLLQLAIFNLLDNALKFTQDGDTITLRAYSEDSQLVIEVADTGRGIPSGDLPHVWEDLYRSADVQGIPGSGIGLAMVLGIVDRHGGTVDIESTLGDGTRVLLHLPIG